MGEGILWILAERILGRSGAWSHGIGAGLLKTILWDSLQVDGSDGRGLVSHQQPAQYHHQSNGGAHFNNAGSGGSGGSAAMMYSPPHSGYPPLPFPIPFSANFPLPLALPFGSSLNSKPNWVIHSFEFEFINLNLNF